MGVLPTRNHAWEQGERNEAEIELVLSGGRKLRIGKGVDEKTLVSVVTALEEKRC